MKVPNTLPQFEGTTALIAVLSTHAARFFSIANGKITPHSDFEIEPIRSQYSDREGHFERRGHGQIYGSGSVYEPKQDQTRQEFLSRAADNLSRILKERNTDEVYLFLADPIKKQFPKSLPKHIRKKISKKLSGNVINEHPTELLKRIKDAQRGPVEVISARAEKILKRYTNR